MRAYRREKQRAMKKSDIVAIAPAVGASLLPSLSCPACWPAYASLLSAVGLTFLSESKYLLWLNVAALLASLIVLWRRTRWAGYVPLAIAALAASAILLGKFWLNSNPANWTGTAAFLAAFVWSGIKSKPASCQRCAGNIYQEVGNYGIKKGR